MKNFKITFLLTIITSTMVSCQQKHFENTRTQFPMLINRPSIVKSQNKDWLNSDIRSPSSTEDKSSLNQSSNHLIEKNILKEIYLRCSSDVKLNNKSFSDCWDQQIHSLKNSKLNHDQETKSELQNELAFEFDFISSALFHSHGTKFSSMIEQFPDLCLDLHLSEKNCINKFSQNLTISITSYLIKNNYSFNNKELFFLKSQFETITLRYFQESLRRLDFKHSSKLTKFLKENKKSLSHKILPFSNSHHSNLVSYIENCNKIINSSLPYEKKYYLKKSTINNLIEQEICIDYAIDHDSELTKNKNEMASNQVSKNLPKSINLHHLKELELIVEKDAMAYFFNPKNKNLALKNINKKQMEELLNRDWWDFKNNAIKEYFQDVTNTETQKKEFSISSHYLESRKSEIIKRINRRIASE